MLVTNLIMLSASRNDHFKTYGSTERDNIEVYIKYNPSIDRKDVWIADYEQKKRFHVPSKDNDDAARIFRAISAALNA